MFTLLTFALLAQASTPSPSPSPSPTPPTSATIVAPTASPEPSRRALPAPLDPIFTGGGGSEFDGPTIGVPTDPGVRVYGWLDPGIEWSTSHSSNYPLTYNDVPNRIQMDQAVLRIEASLTPFNPIILIGAFA